MLKKGSFIGRYKASVRAQEEGRFTQAYNILGQIMADSQGLKSQTLAKIEIRRAECLMASGNYGEAIASVERMVQEHPNNVKNLLESGYFYYKMEKIREAERCYRLAIATDPSDLEAYILLARLYVDTNHFQKSITVLKKGIRIPPQNSRDQLQFVFMLIQLGVANYYTYQYEKSMEYFGQAEAADDSQIFDWDIYGRACMLGGRYVKALDCFDRFLLQNDADNMEIYFLKAKAFSQLGKWEQTREILTMLRQKNGEIQLYPADVRFFAPLIADGWLGELGFKYQDD